MGSEVALLGRWDRAIGDYWAPGIVRIWTLFLLYRLANNGGLFADDQIRFVIVPDLLANAPM
jgi:hypothetical protein